MPIHINATAQIAKSFSVKREKTDDDTESVIAHLKISDAMLDREQIDEVIGLPIGWAQSALFDDFGAPRAALTLALARDDWTLTGTISGGDKPGSPSLTLSDAQVIGIELALTKHGALLSCGLAWVAAGDEVDDIADMLGKLCAIRVVLTGSGQGDLLAA